MKTSRKYKYFALDLLEYVGLTVLEEITNIFLRLAISFASTILSAETPRSCRYHCVRMVIHRDKQVVVRHVPGNSGDLLQWLPIVQVFQTAFHFSVDGRIKEKGQIVGAGLLMVMDTEGLAHRLKPE